MVGRLIAFFGPDGSGKSTHAELLVTQLKSDRMKVRKVWIRSSHTLAYLLSIFFVRIGFYRIATNSFGRQKKIPAVDVSQSFRLFWSIIELLSVLPLILFRVYIPLSLGYTLVAERYIVDTVVTMAYSFGDLAFLRTRIAGLLLRFIPKNTVFIHLDSDYTTIVQRRRSRVEPYEVIKFQRLGYKIVGNYLGSKLIDTSNMRVKQTSMQIMNWLRINNVFPLKET